MNRPRPVASLIHKSSSHTLKALLQRGGRLRQLEEALLSCLDIEAASHCHLLNLRDSAVVLGVDSAAWATRLRYQLPAMLDCIRRLKGMSGIQEVRLVLQPPPVAHREEIKGRSMSLSRESAQALQACAEHIQHTGLRDALHRLARHSKP